jgi:16S rRNA processing protein RimM
VAAPHEPAPAELIAIGKIGRAHGIRGEVLVEPWTDAPQERFGAGTVMQTDPAAVGPLTVESHRFQRDRLIVQFVGYGNPEALAPLRGARVLIPATERTPLDDPDEFYVNELIGLTAVTVAGEELGPVLDIVELPGTDYLLLRVGEVERMVPFVAAIVPEVDVVGGRIVVDPPEGLFDL